MTQSKAEAGIQRKGPQEVAMADNRELTLPGEEMTPALPYLKVLWAELQVMAT